MEGQAQLSSRSCETIWSCAGDWVLGAWIGSQRVAGDRHHIPRANWRHTYGVLQKFCGSRTSTLISVYACYPAAMKESHEAVLDSLGCRTDIDFGSGRLQ